MGGANLDSDIQGLWWIWTILMNSKFFKLLEHERRVDSERFSGSDIEFGYQIQMEAGFEVANVV